MTAPIPPFCRVTNDPPSPARAGGFSLVEVLVAVSVIAILIGLAIVGFRSVGTSSQQGATRALLQTCETLLAELERANNSSLPKQKIRGWAWNPAVPALPEQEVAAASDPAVIDRTQASSPNFASLALDFWYNPQRYRPSGTVTATDKPAPIDGPGDVRRDQTGIGEATDVERYAHPLVVNTAIAMSAIVSVPANEQAVAAIPADRLMLPLWRAGVQSPLRNVDYPIGARISRAIGASVAHYVAIQSVRSPTMNINQPTPAVQPALSATEWSAASKPSQLLLDAWGNPIIFVPASGMNVGTMHQVAKAYKAGDRVFLPSTAGNPQAARIYYVASVDTTSTPPAADWRGPVLNDADHRNDFPAAVVSPVGRPFFASAGPDGNFATHEDNLYSFDN